MAGGGHGSPGGTHAVVQAAIVAGLTGSLVLFHRFAVPPDTGFDPTGLLAFGFVVLASYAVGQLVEVVKLPHITGYLLAGMLYGHSLAHIVGEGWWPPFDRGVLNEEVVGQLGLLDTLAVALIALTAGGELELAGLRRGLKAITGVLAVQLAFVMLGTMALVWLVSGAFPAIQLPGLQTLDTSAALWVGVMVAAVSFATSPAATIAVINGSRAAGPMSRTVLSAVVLKDVFVVIIFSIASVLALQAMGLDDGGDQPLGMFLLQHIGGQILMGMVLGGACALYLRWVDVEVLLFLVGLVYTADFVATQLHVVEANDQPVLMWLAAGFTVANFSKRGHDLIHSVEKLSLPVYVVFFTLAGARLHLSELWALAPYAFALVGIRAAMVLIGTRLGARLGDADPATRQHGWMGFLSQAGVALSLGAIIGQKLGDQGRALETLILAAVAVNELIGPVCLKVGLGLAGEIGGADREAAEAEAEANRETLEPMGPAEDPDEEPKPLRSWPESVGGPDVWGGSLHSESPELDALIADLQVDLASLVDRVAEGPLARFQVGAERYLRELRREFLRHNRRLVVLARTHRDPGTIATRLRVEQRELALRWRGIVMTRGVDLHREDWTPDQLVESIDQLVQSLPQRVAAKWEPTSFTGPAEQSAWLRLRRSALRARRRWHSALGGDLPLREVHFRALCRYHLSGRLPVDLEGLAALLIDAERHVTARTETLFETIVRDYDVLAALAADEPGALEARLVAEREDLDKGFGLALDEVERMARDGRDRAARVLGRALKAIKEDALTFGTLDLPAHRRATSRVFRERVRAMDTLTEDLVEVRRNVAAGYSLLALQLELVELTAAVKEILEDQVSQLENDVRGRTVVQAERVDAAIAAALQRLEDELERDLSGDELSARLRQVTDAAEKVVGEAHESAQLLYEQLLDERTVAPLLDALARASRSLTDEYVIAASRLLRGEWKLPKAATLVEVPFRELVATFVETHLTPHLLQAAHDAAERVHPLVTSLSELERLIAFNVELASGELELVAEEAVPDAARELLREMLAGSLERSQGVIQGYVAQAPRWASELGDEVRSSVLDELGQLHADLVDGKITRSELEAMRRAARGRRILREAEALPSQLSRAREQIGRALLSLIGNDRVDAWRRTLGLPAAEGHASIERELFVPPPVIDTIPVVYRRLFSSDTVEAGDVLTGRDTEVDDAIAVLSGRRGERLRSVAVVGVDGVGKSALSSAIVRKGAWRSVRRITFDGPQSVAQVHAILDEIGEPSLVILDGLHWLLCMRPGGFAPLRELVSRVVTDAGDHAWLVHAGELFWRYASHVAPLGDAFPTVIELPPLTESELQAAVLARHSLSGCGLSFEPQQAESALEGLVLTGAGRIRRPYERYFRQLHAASGGLVRDALRLWLASVRRVDADEPFVHVGAVPRSAYNALLELPDEALLMLFQIARQGWMDPVVQSHLYRVDRATAEAQLARLASLGLLVTKDGEIFRIAVHLRGAVERAVRDKGWA